MTNRAECIRNVAILGGGQMAEALIRGLLEVDACAADDLLITDLQSERLAFLRREFGVRVTADNAGAVAQADVVVLAVKPQQMEGLLEEIRLQVNPRTLVLSIAAGIQTAWIEQQLGGGIRVVRAMPNLPALVGRAAAALCGGRWADEDDLQRAERILGSVGVVVRVAESDIDAVTALSGSGPAYVCVLVEAMLRAAREMGLNDDAAHTLVHATIAGTAAMLDRGVSSAAELRRRVTSPGGTTAAALDEMKNRRVTESVVAAILAAHRRAGELARR